MVSTTIDSLVEDLERSYRETQERMSDPAVYNDRREAAQIGRRLKQLEEPHRLAEEWLQARADLDAARDDPELGGLVPEYEQEAARLEEELKLALVTADPADAKDAIVEVRSGRAATRPRYGPATCTACSRATPRTWGTRSNSSRRAPTTEAATST